MRLLCPSIKQLPVLLALLWYGNALRVRAKRISQSLRRSCYAAHLRMGNGCSSPDAGDIVQLSLRTPQDCRENSISLHPVRRTSSSTSGEKARLLLSSVALSTDRDRAAFEFRWMFDRALAGDGHFALDPFVTWKRSTRYNPTHQLLKTVVPSLNVQYPAHVKLPERIREQRMTENMRAAVVKAHKTASLQADDLFVSERQSGHQLARSPTKCESC